VNSAPRSAAYFCKASDLLILSAQILSSVAITSPGTPFGMMMPKWVATSGSLGTHLVIGSTL
jgi:hypothetical protein